MRTETVELTYYQFDELDDEAKETARQWFRGCIDSDDLADHEYWQAIAAILGIEFSTRSVRLYGGGTRRDPQIYWTLNPDSAAFAGRYSYAKGAPQRIREYAPKDTDLHSIADRLAACQRRAFYQLRADCETAGRDGTTQRVNCWHARGDWDDYQELESALTDFAHWIGQQVSREYDYRMSDEYVDECIRANGYEFDESGKLA